MKVNYINENGINVTKEIKINFSNISETNFQKTFKGCTTFDSDNLILKGIQKYSLSEIQKMFQKLQK